MPANITSTARLKCAPSSGALAVPSTGSVAFSSWSSWVEVITTSVDGLIIAGVVWDKATDGFLEIDVAIGIAGLEESVFGAENHFRINGKGSSVGSPAYYLLPAPITGLIPAGSRVAMRSRGDTPTPATGLGLLYYEVAASTIPNISTQVPSSFPDGWGPSFAYGMPITPNASAWANSAWVELTSGVACAIDLFSLSIQCQGLTNGLEFEIDLATGLAAAESVITTVRGAPDAPGSSTTAVINLPAPYPINANTRVSARLRKAGTSTTQWLVSLQYYSCPTAVTNVCPLISKSHNDPFYRGQLGATFSITVENDSDINWTSSTSVTDVLPVGLSLVSMSGTGWTCANGVCTRSDTLAPGASFPPITVTVNVASNASATLINIAQLSGCSDFSDTVNIVDASPAGSRTTTRWALYRFDIKPRGEGRS